MDSSNDNGDKYHGINKHPGAPLHTRARYGIKDLTWLGTQVLKGENVGFLEVVHMQKPSQWGRDVGAGAPSRSSSRS